MKTEKIVLDVHGMTCRSCEKTIVKALYKHKGILQARADYASGKLHLGFFPELIDRGQIEEIIQQVGYETSSIKGSKKSLILKTMILLVAMLIVYQLLSRTGLLTFVPQIQTGSSLFMIFVVGLMTSVHCVAMCGGISLAAGASGKKQSSRIVSEVSRKKAAGRALQYNVGRNISYTITGAIAGLLGQAISISNTGRTVIMLIAGVFMLIMGLNVLELTPWVRKIRMPLPSAIVGLQARMSKNSAFWVGLFNGLMPCGPLQMMQLYALGTGSVAIGALSMMLFALGTTPMMFSVSFFSGLLTNKKSHFIKIASAALVILLGIQMLGRAIDIPMLIQARQTNRQIESADGTFARIEDGYQVVETRFTNGRYQPIVVQAGLPVHWVITAEQGDLNGCNYSLLIDDFDIAKDLDYGETVIEFLPKEVGVFRYTCWMNMISSRITVVSDLQA